MLSCVLYQWKGKICRLYGGIKQQDCCFDKYQTLGKGHWTITFFRHVGNSQGVKLLTTIFVIRLP